jgi:hypothetical protein
MPDGLDLLETAAEGGVGDLQDAAGERLVLHDERRDLRHRAVLA